MANTATVELTGVSTYCQSFQHGTPKLTKELPDAYEERTWRNKAHRDKEGFVVMPALSFKHCIAEAAKFLSIQIPGKGKSTYTKHFEAGVLVAEPPQILIRSAGGDYVPIKAEEVPAFWVNVPSDGVAGSGKRVRKCFPIIPSGWKATVNYLILDATITPEVFRDHLVQAVDILTALKRR